MRFPSQVLFLCMRLVTRNLMKRTLSLLPFAVSVLISNPTFAVSYSATHWFSSQPCPVSDSRCIPFPGAGAISGLALEADDQRFWVATNERSGSRVRSYVYSFNFQAQSGQYESGQFMSSDTRSCRDASCFLGIPNSITEVRAAGQEPTTELWITGSRPHLVRWQWSADEQRYEQTQVMSTDCDANFLNSYNGCIEFPAVRGSGSIFINRLNAVSISPNKRNVWVAGDDFIVQLVLDENTGNYQAGQWIIRGNCPVNAGNNCLSVPTLFLVTSEAGTPVPLEAANYFLNAGDDQLWAGINVNSNRSGGNLGENSGENSKNVWEFVPNAESRYQSGRHLRYGDCPVEDRLCRSVFSSSGKSSLASSSQQDWGLGGGTLWTRTQEGYGALFSSTGLCSTFTDNSVAQTGCQSVSGLAGEQTGSEDYYLVASDEVPEVLNNEFYSEQGVLIGADSDSVHVFQVNPFYREEQGRQDVVDYTIERYPFLCEQSPRISASCQFHDGTPQACGNATQCSFDLPGGCDWDQGYTGNPFGTISCACPGCCRVNNGNPDGQLADLFFSSGLALALGRNDQVLPVQLFWAGYHLNGTLDNNHLVTGSDSECGLFEDTLEIRGIYATQQLGNRYFVAVQKNDDRHYVLQYVQSDFSGFRRLTESFPLYSFRPSDLIVTEDFLYYIAQNVNQGHYLMRRVTRTSKKLDILSVPNNPSEASVSGSKLNQFSKVGDRLYVGGRGTVRILPISSTLTSGFMLVCFENTENASLRQSRPCSNFNSGYGVVVLDTYGAEAEVLALEANTNRILVAGRAPDEGDFTQLFMHSFEPSGSVTSGSSFSPVVLRVGGDVSKMLLTASIDHIDWIFQRGDQTVEWRRYSLTGTPDAEFGCRKVSLPKGTGISQIKLNPAGDQVYIVGKTPMNEALLQPLTFSDDTSCSAQ